MRDPFDVGLLWDHHSMDVGADVPHADVVAEDDEDIGFFLGCCVVR